jgi:hypothetical protein
MAENTQATNPFMKMFEELNAPLCGPLKQAAAQWIDTSAEWAHKALEWNEKMTTWAKETPLASVFATQRSLASQTIENSTALARSLWRIEPKTDEKTA